MGARTRSEPRSSQLLRRLDRHTPRVNRDAHFHLRSLAPLSTMQTGQIWTFFCSLGLSRDQTQEDLKPSWILSRSGLWPSPTEGTGTSLQARRFRCRRRLSAVHAPVDCLLSLCMCLRVVVRLGRSLMSALTIKPSGLTVSLYACLCSYHQDDCALCPSSGGADPRASLCDSWDRGQGYHFISCMPNYYSHVPGCPMPSSSEL